jgi:hypothetical protein
MTASASPLAVARRASAPGGIYDDYRAFVAGLPCGEQGKRLRCHNARAFLGASEVSGGAPG